jgi:hypothetical protein
MTIAKTYIAHDQNRLVIPDAYIIDELNDKSLETHENSYVRLPSYYDEAEDQPPQSETQTVIIIEL